MYTNIGVRWKTCAASLKNSPADLLSAVGGVEYLGERLIRKDGDTILTRTENPDGASHCALMQSMHFAQSPPDKDPPERGPEDCRSRNNRDSSSATGDWGFQPQFGMEGWLNKELEYLTTENPIINKLGSLGMSINVLCHLLAKSFRSRRTLLTSPLRQTSRF